MREISYFAHDLNITLKRIGKVFTDLLFAEWFHLSEQYQRKFFYGYSTFPLLDFHFTISFFH